LNILLPQNLTLMPVEAGCGLAKLLLEFSAVGDFEEKQQPLVRKKVCPLNLDKDYKDKKKLA